jgi:hypothetical protein
MNLPSEVKKIRHREVESFIEKLISVEIFILGFSMILVGLAIGWMIWGGK